MTTLVETAAAVREMESQSNNPLALFDAVFARQVQAAQPRPQGVSHED